MAQPLSEFGEREERAVQARSMRDLFEQHDAYEVQAMQRVAARVTRAMNHLDGGHPAYRDLLLALDELGDWFRKDRVENAMHAEIAPDAVLLGVAS